MIEQTQTATSETSQTSGAGSSQAASPNGSAVSGGATLDQSQAQASTINRPDGLHDRFFDAATGVKVPDLLKEFGELEAYKAGQDLKSSLVPEKADGYKIEGPANFQAPDGVEVKLDPNDPRVAVARDWAHKAGLSQDQFSELLGIEMNRAASELQSYNEQRTAFVKSLGQNGQQRLDRVQAVATNLLGGDVASELMQVAVTSKLVGAFERLLSSQVGSGAGSPGYGGRSAGSVDEASYAKMSFEEKMNHARGVTNRR